MRNPLLFLACLLAPGVLYLASIGPVAYAQIRLGWFQSDAMNPFYAPLQFMPDSGPCAVAMENYVELWIGRGDCGGTGTGG